MVECHNNTTTEGYQYQFNKAKQKQSEGDRNRVHKKMSDVAHGSTITAHRGRGERSKAAWSED